MQVSKRLTHPRPQKTYDLLLQVIEVPNLTKVSPNSAVTALLLAFAATLWPLFLLTFCATLWPLNRLLLALCKEAKFLFSQLHSV